MDRTLFEWLMNIPVVISNFGNWLVSPIYQPYITLSPLELLGIGGITTIIAIIGVHIVRLFV